MVIWSTRHTLLLFLIAALIFMGIFFASCPQGPSTQSKASSALQSQVNLRKEQLANPNPDRLVQMQDQGMNVSNLNLQRIYIYLKQPLTPAQVDEIKSMGVTPYPESWVPPATNHPTGFILADMPVDKLEALAGKNYVVSLDTAEIKLTPQSTQAEGVCNEKYKLG